MSCLPAAAQKFKVLMRCDGGPPQGTVRPPVQPLWPPAQVVYLLEHAAAEAEAAATEEEEAAKESAAARIAALASSATPTSSRSCREICWDEDEEWSVQRHR